MTEDGQPSPNTLGPGLRRPGPSTVTAVGQGVSGLSRDEDLCQEVGSVRGDGDSHGRLS